MTLRAATRILVLALAGGLPAPAAGAERALPLVVAVGPELRARPDWRQDLGRATAYVQATLGEAVAGRFRVAEVVAWQPRGETLEEMLGALRRQVAPRSGAIVVGLTRRHATPEYQWGLSSYGEALAVVTTWRSADRYGPALAHEIAHLFGALHETRTGRVMSGADPGPELSPLNEALLRLHRERRLSPGRFPLARPRLAEALRLYRSAATRDPQALALETRTALEAGDDLGALAAAEALTATGADPQAPMLRALALRHLGRTAAALAAYDEALESRPDDADLHYNRGDALAERDPAGAEEDYRRALALNPAHVAALSSLARLLARTGRASEARECAARAVDLAPDFAPARVNLGLAELRDGRPQRALEAAEVALRGDPASPGAHALRGAALLALGRPRDARDALERGVAANPESAELHESLGRARRELGDLGGARRSLRRARDLAPARASVHVELGLVELDAADPGRAAGHFEAATRLEPSRLSAWVDLAAARLAQGRAEATEAACRRALELAPGAPRALTTLGLLRRAQGRGAEALALQERAAAGAPHDADVLANLADLYLDLGRREAARDAYLRLLEQRPGDAVAHNNLAVLLFRLGDAEGAAEHVARAAELGAAVAPGFLQALAERRASR